MVWHELGCILTYTCSIDFYTFTCMCMQVFMRFGLPRAITSDQGKEFHNELNRELARRLQIDHRLSTPYHPQVRLRVQMHLNVHVYTSRHK